MDDRERLSYLEKAMEFYKHSAVELLVAEEEMKSRNAQLVLEINGLNCTVEDMKKQYKILHYLNEITENQNRSGARHVHELQNKLAKTKDGYCSTCGTKWDSSEESKPKTKTLRVIDNDDIELWTIIFSSFLSFFVGFAIMLMVWIVIGVDLEDISTIPSYSWIIYVVVCSCFSVLVIAKISDWRTIEYTPLSEKRRVSLGGKLQATRVLLKAAKEHIDRKDAIIAKSVQESDIIEYQYIESSVDDWVTKNGVIRQVLKITRPYGQDSIPVGEIRLIRKRPTVK